MEQAAQDDDAKPASRLRMPKPLPAHLQALELKSAAARRESREHEGGVSTDVGPETDDAPRLVQTQSPTQWQRDEHDRFMQALERFGRDQSGDEWHKIAAFVRTRSPDEVQQHGRCYLQQLVQEEYPSPSSLEFGDRGFDDNQNDPNGQNHMMFAGDDVEAAGGRSCKHGKGRGKSGAKASALNTGIRSFQQQQQQQQQTLNDAMLQASAPRKSGRKPKVWTFDEDKILENALASWSSDKPYSWQKIATALPGKTAKDARSRYEKLVGDVAVIETSEDDPSRHRHHYLYAYHSPAYTRATRSSSLSARIAPPPPIQVLMSDAAEDGDAKGSVRQLLVC